LNVRNAYSHIKSNALQGFLRELDMHSAEGTKRQQNASRTGQGITR